MRSRIIPDRVAIFAGLAPDQKVPAKADERTSLLPSMTTPGVVAMSSVDAGLGLTVHSDCAFESGPSAACKRFNAWWCAGVLTTLSRPGSGPRSTGCPPLDGQGKAVKGQWNAVKGQGKAGCLLMIFR